MAYLSTLALTLALALVACESSSGTTTDTASSSGSSGSTGSDGSDGSGSSGGSSGEGSGSTGEPTSSTSAAAGTTVDLPGVHFTQDVWPIVLANCSCHITEPDGMTPGVAAYPTLGEDPAGAYLVLVDQPSSAVGLDFVEPDDSAASYLFHKISGTQVDVGGGGEAMPPYPGPMLSAEQIATIKEWIDTGALE